MLLRPPAHVSLFNMYLWEIHFYFALNNQMDEKETKSRTSQGP